MMYWMLFAANAWAASGGHGDGHHHIPWSTIFVQTFNLVLLLGLLGFILRKTVVAHFANRAKEYHELVQKAEAARQQAEQGRATIKERMAKLEATAENTVAQARAEAAELRSRMMNEAKDLTEKMGQEGQRTATLELEKAKLELRRELLSGALAVSRETLKKNLSSTEQKKLQNEFVDKIQVVSG